MLQEKKWKELERVVGESVREEESEREDLAEGEESGNHLHNMLTFSATIAANPTFGVPLFFSFFQQVSELSHMFGLVFLIDESDKEVALRLETKEE